MNTLNTLDRLNAVIDYVEKNISKDLNLNHLADIACRSLYDFQRLFSFIADMSIIEYIRKRRLTLAGIDLKYNNAEIMDTAFKYGYDSPSSFARAFRAFHEVSPSEARKSDVKLKVFPRLMFGINVKEVQQVIRTDKITVNGKEYDASYFGEKDFSNFDGDDIKADFWQLKDAYEDFKSSKDIQPTSQVRTVYPMNVELDQVFIVDTTKKDGSVERKYYLSDGSMYENTLVTREYRVSISTRTDKITVNGKEYEASYFGERDVSQWTSNDYPYTKEDFWRLENAYDDFKNNKDVQPTSQVRNMFLMNTTLDEVYIVDCTRTDGSVERKYFLSDGSMYENTSVSREYRVGPTPVIRVDKMTVGGKEYDASYFGGFQGGEMWRLENAYADFKDKYKTGDCLPYDHYPMTIDEEQVYVAQFKKEDGTVESYYSVSEGFIWKGMPSTLQVLLEPKPPERVEKWSVGGKEYEASYLRSMNIPDWDFEKELWGEVYESFELWRLENAYADFKDSKKTGDAVPHECLPVHFPMKLEKGQEQVFALNYTKKDGGSVERKYYLSDGTVWKDMPAIIEFVLE